jgi:hypothetical protein
MDPERLSSLDVVIGKRVNYLPVLSTKNANSIHVLTLAVRGRTYNNASGRNNRIAKKV